MPEISVIMGVYNQRNRRSLEASIDSILNQTYKDIEFIIYDDGSEKETAKALKEISKKDERIVFLGASKNHGLAYSLNACIQKARGRYIARMDADDISYPKRLEIQKNYLDEYKEYAFVGCNADLFDDDGVWGSRKMPEKPQKTDFLKYSPYIHPTVMYRSEIFKKEIGYNTSKENLRCEDYELFMRLTALGFKGANIQLRLFAYREDEKSQARRSMRYRISEAKCRYTNFKRLGIMLPKGWIYVLRPIVAGLIPESLRTRYKRKESANEYKKNSFRFGNYDAGFVDIGLRGEK